MLGDGTAETDRDDTGLTRLHADIKQALGTTSGNEWQSHGNIKEIITQFTVTSVLDLDDGTLIRINGEEGDTGLGVLPAQVDDADDEGDPEEGEEEGDEGGDEGHDVMTLVIELARARATAF